MKRILKSVLVMALMMFFGAYTYAQTGITGTVKDSEYNSSLPGAAIMIKGTTEGTITNIDGDFELPTQAGTFDIIISFLGYEDKTVSVTVTSGKMTRLGEISLEGTSQGILEIYVTADRAKERETPVAISNIDHKQIENELGSRDIPLILNSTPSVYSTQQGGGAGDARINVRGFDQRNVAIMINGVPVNDMENGWVYWSNWDGIADATSSIQMQRGLSAVNLATPSIGGTMNIITSPASHKAGGSLKFEYGSGNFMKASLAGNTGLINDKFALSVGGVRKSGVGVIDKTWTDAWAYYVGASYKINKKHKLEFYAMGAPQRHGQNLYKQNIAAYSHEYAKEFGYTQDQLDQYPEADASIQYPGYSDAKSGRYYNENWSPVSESYNGKQYWNGKEHDRHDKGFLNERENFYSKPLINLNWYSHWTDKISQYTVLYYSGGKGGGTGTIGSVRYNYHEGITSPSRFVHWDATIARNEANGASLGVLRNSRNNQATYGALSKVKILFNENLKGSVGIDWRTAEIEHYREVRDLLGGTHFVDTNDDFANSDNKVLGDRIAYNNTNTVDWFGYYAQMEYSNEKITAYATFGNSYMKYTFVDHFADDGTGNELTTKSESLPGYQLKGGISYRFLEGFSAFVNYGYISKAPIFDNVINDYDGALSSNPENEIFNAFEIGLNYISPSKDIDVKVNYYNTNWQDRALTRGFQNQDGSEDIIHLSGMDQLHKGFEIEASYQPFNFLAIGGAASFANWEYTSDVSGTYVDYSSGEAVDTDYNLYIKGLKVGDAPQTQYAIMLTLIPIKDLRLQFDYRHYKNHYAGYNPIDRDDATDTEQVWRSPAYNIFDMHFSYKLPIKSDKLGIKVFAHVFNLLDERYIQDASDESSYNAVSGAAPHSAMRAEVFYGLPRTYNVGVKVSF